jgi:hypothetical protein
MTEQEWLECSDPIAMRRFLFGPIAKWTDQVVMSRKNLLLVCACFERLGKLVPERARCWQQHAAQAVEGHYEKRKLHGEGEEADVELNWAMDHARVEGRGRLRALSDLWVWLDAPAWKRDRSTPFWEAERKEQAALTRDIFGNPFRPVVFDPIWRSATVIALAQATYDDRILPAGALDADRLAVLADALEDTGCDNANILSHLRGPGPHVRGCWALDLLLGKK